VAQLAALFLKGSLWKLGPGVDLFGIGDIPLKTKNPGGSRDALLYERILPYQRPPCQVPKSGYHSCPIPSPAFALKRRRRVPQVRRWNLGLGFALFVVAAFLGRLLYSAVGAANVSPARLP